jgi:hypothetical protein
MHDRHSQSSEAQAGSDVMSVACRAAYSAPPGREEGHYPSQSRGGFTWQGVVGLLDLRREGQAVSCRCRFVVSGRTRDKPQPTEQGKINTNRSVYAEMIV